MADARPFPPPPQKSSKVRHDSVFEFRGDAASAELDLGGVAAESNLRGGNTGWIVVTLGALATAGGLVYLLMMRGGEAEPEAAEAASTVMDQALVSDASVPVAGDVVEPVPAEPTPAVEPTSTEPTTPTVPNASKASPSGPETSNTPSGHAKAPMPPADKTAEAHDASKSSDVAEEDEAEKPENTTEQDNSNRDEGPDANRDETPDASGKDAEPAQDEDSKPDEDEDPDSEQAASDDEKSEQPKKKTSSPKTTNKKSSSPKKTSKPKKTISTDKAPRTFDKLPPPP